LRWVVGEEEVGVEEELEEPVVLVVPEERL